MLQFTPLDLILCVPFVTNLSQLLLTTPYMDWIPQQKKHNPPFSVASLFQNGQGNMVELLNSEESSFQVKLDDELNYLCA